MCTKDLLKWIALALLMVGCGGDYKSLSSQFSDFSFEPQAPPPLCSIKDKSMESRAIYGADDRLEWYQAPPITVAWARSTMALIFSNQLSDEGVRYKVVSQTHGKSSNLCPGVSFAEQPSAAYCSGFLVSEDLVVTAGHCIKSAADCSSTFFVFDFSKTSPGQKDYYIDKKNVYRCSKLIAQNVSGGDYAVVKLDQKVSGRTPLNIRRSGSVPVGNELVLIGHPSGLPSKIADGGVVRQSGNLIVASVDAFAGNSGSPVINMSTGLVEGILVAGEPDFLNQGSCQVENRCGASCLGEQITPIAKTTSYIPNITYDSPSCDGQVNSKGIFRTKRREH